GLVIDKVRRAEYVKADAEGKAVLKGILVKPDYAHAYNNLGIAYARLGQRTDAIAAFKKAVAIKPDDAKAYYNMGLAHGGLGQSTDAITSFEKALAIKSDYVEAYYNMGIAYQYLKQHTEALVVYKKAIAIKPDYADAYYTALSQQKVCIRRDSNGKKPITIETPRFWCIGATTDPWTLPNPLRQRFTVLNFEYYSELELVKLLTQRSRAMRLEVEDGVFEALAKRGKETPRVCISHLRACHRTARRGLCWREPVPYAIVAGLTVSTFMPTIPAVR
ncbi:MAG: tetratricopeptide repeat protein, partial [Phycisphaerae bacterium]|nr:tetratricopeptide repeat protein [Phycisphaerae bacterium]